MEIALIAHDKKKELMAQFCIAYCNILKKNNICATAKTGKYVMEATKLDIELLFTGTLGGEQQIASKISYDEIDCLLYFRDTDADRQDTREAQDMFRLCDMHNVPFATNIASAEILICAIDRGDLDWRNYINPIHARKHPHNKNLR